MQREKENARNVGYAAWLGEEEQKKKDQLAAADTLKGEQASIVEYILGQDRAEITDGDMALLKGLGYSDEAINGAATALLGYRDTFEQRKAEKERIAKEEELKTQTSAILDWASENGLEEIPSLKIPLLKSMGYSDEAIAAAQNAFAEGKKAEADAANKTFIDSLAKFNTDGDAVAFLEANGLDASGMDDAAITSAVQSAVEDAFKNGKISAEERSAWYRDNIISYESDSDTIGSVVDAAASIIGKADELKDKISENDYRAILTNAYDRLNVVNVSLGDKGYAADEVKITVDINGVERTYVADMSGEARASKERNKTLNATFGDSSLAYYDGKVYYQYDTDKWVQISTKKGWGSPGSTSEGNDVLRVVAAYCGENKSNYRTTPEFRQGGGENATDKTLRVGKAVSESDWRKLQNGTMSREEFINITAKRYGKRWTVKADKAIDYVEEYLKVMGIN
jgi:hypothetical protein